MASTFRSEDFSGTVRPVDLQITTAGTDVAIGCSDDDRIHVRLEANADVDLQTATIRLDGTTLVVDVPPLAPDGPAGFALRLSPRTTINIGGGNVRSEIQVELPALGSARIETKSGDITVAAFCDDLQLHTDGGNVEVEHAAAATVASASGDVAIASAGDLAVTTASGDVTVEHAGSARLGSGSGDIRVDSVEGSLAARTASGDIDVESAGGGVTVTTASGDATIAGIGRGKVEASTVSGDLELRFAAGVPVWTDVTTVSGELSNELSSRGEPRDGEPFVEVTARTVSGDLTLLDD